ncbi:hypothetical protein [Flavobacterium sp. NRK1]|uniref:hypothetical protein n=1 Tax=Flavobacterium sp. NRK1 TaxID=2954929 RepID=UPI0020932C9D|nr:hypothetical protein [Flavobacterium sp. NRK1]MCO6147448.1 hypothetical protein [Flavobacterium sp. NRK1]
MLGLLLIVTVSCSKSQKLTISNNSSSAFYIMDKHTADHINAEKLYSLKESGEIEHVSANGGIYTYVGTGEALDKYTVDSTYVFCFVNDTELTKNVKGKSRFNYEEVKVSPSGNPDAMEIDITIQDTLDHPVFSSSLKMQFGF